MKLCGLFVGICLALAPVASHASTLTTCGQSAGWSYFFDSDLTRGRSGWTQDAIDGSRIAVRLLGDEIDVIYHDTRGGPFSYRDSGASVRLATMESKADGGIVFSVLVEDQRASLLVVYTFNLDAAGFGSVAWANMRAGGLLPKASLMVAPCAGG